jgi:hypothetical protein
MGFFPTFSEAKQAGFDLGKKALSTVEKSAVAVGNVTKKAAIATYDATKDVAIATYDATKNAAVATYDYASEKVDDAATATKNAEGKALAKSAGKIVDKLTSNATDRQALLNKIDKRSKYKYIGNELDQKCPNTRSTHPNPNDGRFMGSDCCSDPKGKGNRNTDKKPSQGKKPSCYTGNPKKEFPKVSYQNGMNNTEEQVCETMQQIADSQCVEVIGVYNATYNDPTRIKAADADYSNVKKKAIEQALLEGEKGAVKGAVKGAMTGVVGGPAGVAAGAAVGAAKGAAVGAAKGAVLGGGKEAALEKASTSGMVQDVMDCLDNLNSAGTEASVMTQSEVWVESLRKGEHVEIYAHSQGGLITREALVQTRKTLAAKMRNELIQSGHSVEDAKTLASAYADKQMKNVTVNSFGTLESDLPPGPTYNRMTNASDPVPEVIRAAQKNYGRPTEQAPPNSPPVHRFNNNPSVKDPFAAHGMPCYLAELEQTQGGKKACC